MLTQQWLDGAVSSPVELSSSDTVVYLERLVQEVKLIKFIRNLLHFTLL